MHRRKLARRFGLLLTAFAALNAQEHSTTQNPFNSQADRAAGEKLFRAQCAACHGPGGIGGAGGPELVTGTFRHGHSDDAVFKTVMKGVPGTNMPAFPGSAREAWQVVSYLRTLSEGRAGERATGDAAKGAALFREHGCAGCHPTDGESRGTGPDISNIGVLRSMASLRRSILAPDDDVSPEYWSLRARTRTGQAIEGRRLNEDTFSYQYVDKSGLRSVHKLDLAEHTTVRTSPMPAYKSKLTDNDVDHLVAFLATQKKAGGR
jgi:putative heme-binding domain-containing protein